ncbi:MAG: hypothetical protein K9N35_06195 [Candidatus Marinimicrobia bacterium]|nr:hypothetical protein [Candidatus Neomarinimicrobiota bacterium]
MTVGKNQKMEMVHGYSIWLMPEPNDGAELGKTIAALSKKLEGPVFPAHLTIQGQISEGLSSILPKFRSLSEEISPLELTTEMIGTQEAYYRALFYKIEKSAELEDLNKRARTSFRRASDPEFFPHVSLLYGSILESEKQKLLPQLETTLPQTICFTHLVLMKTQGPVDKWELVEDVELK